MRIVTSYQQIKNAEMSEEDLQWYESEMEHAKKTKAEVIAQKNLQVAF
jgi:hypothetical protein